MTNALSSGVLKGPDTRRAVWVGFFCIWYSFFGWSALSATPVLYVGLMREYGLTREQASLPFTIMLCTSFISSGIYGILTRYFRERHLLILGSSLASFSLIVAAFVNGNFIAICALLGVAYGFGVSCTTVLPSTILSQYFIKYRATAIGMFSVAVSLTGVAFPPISAIFLDTYDVSACLLLVGALTMNQFVSCVVCDAAPWKAQMLPPVPQNVGDSTQKETTGFAQFRPLLSGFLFHVCLTNAFANLIMFTLTLIIVDFAFDNGISSDSTNLIVIILSFGWTVASVIVGPIVDKGYATKQFMVLSSCVIQGVSLVIMTVFKGSAVIMAISSFGIGWGQGSRGFLLFVLLSQRFAISLVPTAFAIMNFVCVVPFIARTPIIGYVRDTLGSYDYLNYGLSAIDFAMMITWFVYVIMLRVEARQKSKPPVQTISVSTIAT